MKIGFFDSGLGGLTVMKAAASHLPMYDYEFFGDTANVPYGDKTEEDVFSLTKAGVEHLFNKGCTLVIIACNIASAETLRKLQDTFLAEEYPDRKILGVIIPMVEAAVQSGAKSAVVIGTRRTIESGKYQREIEKFPKRPSLKSIATPGLVPLIEEGRLEEAAEEAYEAIKRAVEEGSDCLILGCTHYSLLEENLKERLGKGVQILNPIKIIPEKLKQYLDVHDEIREKLSVNGTRNIFLSRNSASYDEILNELLGGVFIQSS